MYLSCQKVFAPMEEDMCWPQVFDFKHFLVLTKQALKLRNVWKAMEAIIDLFAAE